MICLLIAVSSFTDSERFERWSHFKDYGVPGTANDPTGQASVADATCRMLGGSFDGFDFWRHPSRVAGVLNTLKTAPPTSNPSWHVLHLKSALVAPCSAGPGPDPTINFPTLSLSASLANWHHALCAPASDPSWNDHYDPAEMPQQVVLTAGLMCIAAADLNSAALPADVMSSINLSARQDVCDTFPWGGPTRFGGISSRDKLAAASAPLLTKVCSRRASALINEEDAVPLLNGPPLVLTGILLMAVAAGLLAGRAIWRPVLPALPLH